MNLLTKFSMRFERRSLKYWLILLTSVACIPIDSAQAGFIEVSGTGSYRRANIGTEVSDVSKSITGSISYYFNEASALELSYTEGNNHREVSIASANSSITHLFYSSIGLDFVYTIGKRESLFRPYIKAGASYMLKKRVLTQVKTNGQWNNPDIVEIDPGVVPTAGLGFKLGLTEQLSLKVGVDAWTSEPTNRTPLLIDYAGRAGLSWLF